MRKKLEDSPRERMAALQDIRKSDRPSTLPLRASKGAAHSLHRSALLKDLGDGVQLVAGNAGDHSLVLQLLVQVYQSSIGEDFQSRLDDPGYEPSDRILLMRSGQLIGHVQISKHIGWFQQQRCPVARLQDFVTLPEYRGATYGRSLLQVAEETASREGAVVGYVQTNEPEWFREQGWSVCRGQGHTQANTHGILSHFDAQWANPRRKRPKLEIRAWRHFEADSLRAVYQQMCPNLWGCLQRSEQTWQWLLGRKAHDQVLIAVKRDGKQPTTPHAGQVPHIVGYAVTRDAAIVEMFTLPGYPAASSQLVARACRDAIDRDHRFLSLHTPAADPMHELLVTAGGSWVSDAEANGGVAMMKLLAPQRWVERMYPVFHQRTRETGISSSQKVEFGVDDGQHQFVLTRRSARLEEANSTETKVHCSWTTFQDLLLSNLRFSETTASEQLAIDDSTNLSTLATLFSPKLFWQSPLELLRL